MQFKITFLKYSIICIITALVVMQVLYYRRYVKSVEQEAMQLRKDAAALSVAVDIEKKQMKQQKVISSAQYDLVNEVHSINKRTKRTVDLVNEEVLSTYDPNLW